jgi:hypothetical protein
MPARQKSEIYFTTVAASPNNFAVFGGHMVSEKSDPTFTRLVILNQGKWGLLGDVMDVVYSLETKQGKDPSKRNLCVLGRDGFFREYVPSEKPIDTPIKKREVGYLEKLRLIGKHLFACGAQGQVYCQKGDSWVNLDEGLFLPFSGKVERRLLSLDGFSEHDIFAVGEGGAVWHWTGQLWNQVDTPTNVSINDVLCSSSGDIYLCGDGGFIFRLTRTWKWHDLSDTALTQQSLWTMVEFRGKIFVAAGDKLLSTNGNTVEEVPVPKDVERNFFSIDAVSDSLWCVGDRDVCQFDGSTWYRHVCPDNK